jgi:diguanylate cyclase (GGDEF)-like protein
VAENDVTNETSPDAATPLATSPATTELSVAQLGALLQDLNSMGSSPEAFKAAHENRLVEMRLGIASSLFSALRHKHAPTAAHSLRVALGCSSWAFALGLHSHDRDELEIAALLHDVGKIGAPDRLLLKPGVLARDEAKLMDQYRLAGLDILANCCSSKTILDIVRHSAGWFDGTKPNYTLAADQIPLAARILAVVDAFDSMTSDQVHRRAMSRDRALHELFKHAGTQFDPELVKAFSEMQFTAQLHREVVSHWLQSLDSQLSNRFWSRTHIAAADAPAAACLETLFQQKLLDNMYDAVIFVDRHMQIVFWNRGAERLTGIIAASVVQRSWSPTLIGMRDERIGSWSDCECPIAYSLATGVQSLRRLLVADRNNRPVAVDLHTVPIVSPDGLTYGAAMVLHDASGEASLEERCQNLHEKATKDPLTQVANRSEFDRAYQIFVNAHLEREMACSLIICDIDHFKSINDTYGHQAGDEVLKTFGQLLKSECRTGDLVARYGGEEFVLLCADCTNAAAARRAEQLRHSIGELPHPALNGRRIAVSFGVTEIQAGDTPDSMLHRADRALLEAKRLGRNMVVQLGNGVGHEFVSPSQEATLQHSAGGELYLAKVLVTAVPLNIAVEKLRGFVLDHHAEILAINADRIDLRIEADSTRPARRRSDRPIPFFVELSLTEQRIPSMSADGRLTGEIAHTRVNVAVRLKRARDRRNPDVAQQANTILAGIKSYLMANDETRLAAASTTRRTANMLLPWLRLRK